MIILKFKDQRLIVFCVSDTYSWQGIILSKHENLTNKYPMNSGQISYTSYTRSEIECAIVCLNKRDSCATIFYNTMDNRCEISSNTFKDNDLMIVYGFIIFHQSKYQQ